MKNFTIRLPYGETTTIRDIFSNPKNWDGMDSPEVLADFSRDDLITSLYNEIRAFWFSYEKKHGRHFYDLDKVVLSQITI